MDLKEKNKYKSEFKKALNTFTEKLEKYVSTENGDWSVKGFIDVYKNIYSISFLIFIFFSFFLFINDLLSSSKNGIDEKKKI